MNVSNLKVSGFSTRAGNAAANQYIIEYVEKRDDGETNRVRVFQSYSSTIARITYIPSLGNGYVDRVVELDENTWEYSRTTGKYRNEFLGEGVAETRKKIESGEYLVVNLND